MDTMYKPYDEIMNTDLRGERLHHLVTKRGTCVEMIRTPSHGIACYMDGVIQSCEKDEEHYHKALVTRAMEHTREPPKRVMIIGGGEGATAREVLSYPSVEHVDMVEWDEEVVELFRTSYPQWARGAWEDPRLHLHYKDIFEVIQSPCEDPYDVVVVDLFDPTEETFSWCVTLLKKLSSWVRKGSTFVMYGGMDEEGNMGNAMKLLENVVGYYPDHRRTVYSVPIESFEGRSMFLLFSDVQTPVDPLQSGKKGVE